MCMIKYKCGIIGKNISRRIAIKFNWNEDEKKNCQKIVENASYIKKCRYFL